MKFERRKTESSKRRLKRIFYISFSMMFLKGMVYGTQNCINTADGVKYCEVIGIESTQIMPFLSILASLSLLVLFLTYVGHIFIEGLEKPKFSPTNLAPHNFVKNETYATSKIQPVEEAMHDLDTKLSFWNKSLVTYISCSILFFLLFIMITPEVSMGENILAGFIFSLPAAVFGGLTPSNNKIVCVIIGAVVSLVGMAGIALYI